MSSSPLYRFAKLLEIKYLTKTALGQSLSEILENAAGYGATSANGIMNFPAFLQQDHAKLNFNVTVNDKMLGGSDIVVSDLKVTPSATTPEGAAAKYEALPQQVKNYLSKHIANFPDIPHGFAIPLEYGRTDSSNEIAGK
jgi:hypothetical protein